MCARYYALFCALFSWLSLHGSVVGQTVEQQAKIQIVNKSGKDIQFAYVVHKFSDAFVDYNLAGYLKTGDGTNDLPDVVRYHTGATTGRDWWRVGFYTTDGWMCHSHPENGKAVFDIINALGPQLAGLAGEFGENVPKGDIPQKAADQLTQVLKNNGLLEKAKTMGFKEHVLKAEDRHQAGDRVVLTISTLTWPNVNIRKPVDLFENMDILQIQSSVGKSFTKVLCINVKLLRSWRKLK